MKKSKRRAPLTESMEPLLSAVSASVTDTGANVSCKCYRTSEVITFVIAIPPARLVSMSVLSRSNSIAFTA